MKTQLVGRVVVKSQTPPLSLLVSNEKQRACLERQWHLSVDAERQQRALGRAKGWRRIVVKRSYTQDSERLSKDELAGGTSPLLDALVNLRLMTDDSEVIFQQVKAEEPFTEVSLYESCEPHSADRAITYRRRRTT